MTTNEARKCAQCGYNLQGLSKGVNCPECGSSRTKSGTSVDTKDGSILRLINANLAVTGLAELPDLRVRMKYWMKLGAIFAFTVLTLQLLVTFAVIPIGLYRLALGVLSMFWPTVVIGMMPSSADAAMPPMYTWIRKLAPATQWCWPIGYVLWLMFHVPFEEYTLGGNLKHFPLMLMLHAVAGIGLAGIAFWIHDLALRLQLDCAAKRCYTFAIATVTLGLFVFVLPWKDFAAYIFVLMGPWLWCVSLFARGLLEISNDAIWSLEYDDGLEGRQERINKKIKEHEHTRWL
ncbi:MAG: hypothetical protein ACI9JK_000131 [Phycisphaerales bacterium]|jgi:hypothetical protein